MLDLLINYTWMKYLVLIIMILNISCSNVQNPAAVSDADLSQVIIEEVLTKDRKIEPVLLYTPNSAEYIDYLIKYPPTHFWQLISSTFNISDTPTIRKLLENSQFLDTTNLSKRMNIKFVNRNNMTIVSPQDLRPNWESAIDVFIMLYERNSKKCIVYIHRVEEGSEVALLEIVKGAWKVTAFHIETIE